MLRAVADTARIPSLPALAAVIAGRRREAMERAYVGQMAWQAAALLYGLGGGEDFPVPDWAAAFPARREVGGPTAAEIRAQVLRRLTRRPSG